MRQVSAKPFIVAFNCIVLDMAVRDGWEFNPDLAETVADEIDALHDAGFHQLAHKLDAAFARYCGLAND